MHFWTFLLAIVCSIFSTSVMSYISMATPIGPWIAPTILLLLFIVSTLFTHRFSSNQLVYILVSSSLGGIIATALGFSFPAIYFADPQTFQWWIQNPLFFCLLLCLLVAAAGGLGYIVAEVIEGSVIDQLSFPISQLIYGMIQAGNQAAKTMQLIVGSLFSVALLVMQSLKFIPTSIQLIPTTSLFGLRFPPFIFDIFPMFWAIGFIAGYIIAIPLLVGAILKFVLIDPINIRFFNYLENTEFILAFGTGLVLTGVFLSFLDLPRFVKNIKQLFTLKTHFSKNYYITTGAAAAICILGLYWIYYTLSFPIIVLLFLLIGSVICSYQITIIAGKAGIAPLGRFATFVMVPAMLIFSLSTSQILLIATFVEICAGVTADILFGRKLAKLFNINRSTIAWYQLLGLVVAACVSGILFWYVITTFKLGSSYLFAYKAKSRALLLQINQFDIYVLLFGLGCGVILNYLKINPALVLGGLLMPVNIIIGLVTGAFLAWLVPERTRFEPFWSGVFAAHSLWMIIYSVFSYMG